MGESAIDQYKAVLERDPKNINSVKGIAYLYLQMKRFEDAKTFYRKAIDLDPNDPEPYYSVAVIDWTQSYQPRMEERAKVGLKPDEWIMKDKSNKKVCEMLREKNSAVIQDGIAMLQKALRSAARLRRRHGLPEPAVPRKGRPGVRRSGGPCSGFEDGRRVGGQDHGHQENQGRKAARRSRHHHAQQVGCSITFSSRKPLLTRRGFCILRAV